VTEAKREVPIQNVYRLLLYAWNLVGEREAVDVDEEGYAELHDLFAHVLAQAVGTLLTRGLDRGYVPRDDSVQGVRGKLDLGATIKHAELASARTRCRFDDLEYDVLHNRIIKATLRQLQQIEKLHPKNRSSVRKLEQKLDAVQNVSITSHDFRLVQLHGNNRLYEFAIGLCWLIHENLMIERRSGCLRFREYVATPQGMGSLFQSFVRNFYRLEQRRFTSRGAKVDWHAAMGTATDVRRLPEMVCDIVLEAPDRCIVLDTKFSAEALVGRGKEKKVSSEHLYQILAYVQNRSASHGGAPHEGMLLYPVVKERFGFDYRLLGHRVQVRSVDLARPWPEIHNDLLQLLEG
jgi:5-methylcytosine-specific restriction enzyme subunit McrC